MKSKNNEFKANLLLRRVYNLIEMSHLNDNEHSVDYIEKMSFPRNLGNDIFNYLQSHDEDFKNIVIKRQKRYRRRMKNKMKNELEMLYEECKNKFEDQINIFYVKKIFKNNQTIFDFDKFVMDLNDEKSCLSKFEKVMKEKHFHCFLNITKKGKEFYNEHKELIFNTFYKTVMKNFNSSMMFDE